MDKVLRGFVPATKDIKIIQLRVTAAFPRDHYKIFSAGLFHLEPAHQQYRLEPLPYISTEAAYGLAAHSKILAVVGIHGPNSKADSHRYRFTGTDGPVSHNAIVIVVGRIRTPPRQQLHLLFTKLFKFNNRFDNASEFASDTHFQISLALFLIASVNPSSSYSACSSASLRIF